MTVEERVRDRLVAAYDAKAAERDARTEATWRDTVADEFLAEVPAGARILDLGAGTGKFAAHFAAGGADVTAVDLTPAHVDLCRAKGLDAHVVDFTRDDLGDEIYDGVWAMNSLLHVPRAELGEVVERIHRCLVPGGLAFICVWGGEQFEGFREGEGYDPPRFLSFMTDDEFRSFPTPGFNRIRTWTLDVHDGDTHPQLTLLRRL